MLRLAQHVCGGLEAFLAHVQQTLFFLCWCMYAGYEIVHIKEWPSRSRQSPTRDKADRHTARDESSSSSTASDNDSPSSTHDSDSAQPPPAKQARAAAKRGKRAARATVDPAAATATQLPPPGSYYEYAGQRVLVPEWPNTKVYGSETLNDTLEALVQQVWREDAPPGRAALGKRYHRLLTDWGREFFLRLKARISALKETDPTRHAEVRSMCGCDCLTLLLPFVYGSCPAPVVHRWLDIRIQFPDTCVCFNRPYRAYRQGRTRVGLTKQIRTRCVYVCVPVCCRLWPRPHGLIMTTGAQFCGRN